MIVILLLIFFLAAVAAFGLGGDVRIASFGVALSNKRDSGSLSEIRKLVSSVSLRQGHSGSESGTIARDRFVLMSSDKDRDSSEGRSSSRSDRST